MTTIALSSTHTEGHEMQRHAPYLASILALFSVIMMSVGAEVERHAIQMVVKKTMAGPEQLQQSSQEIEIIRDRLLVFIIMGGAVAGAAAYICVRIIYADKDDARVRKMLSAGFALSLLTSLFITPYAVKYTFKSNAPEECAAMAFLISIGATFIWDIANKLYKRYSKAAEIGGIQGIIREHRGGNTEPQPTIPSVTEEKKP